ncbi:MAG: EamA family transporter [Candidatus Woesebacteria bacterium]|nr:EamA family transporter [Candidatus Woesebacteria bacterium]
MTTSYFILILASMAIGLTYIVNKKLSHGKFDASTFTFLISYVNAIISIPLLFFNFYVSKNPFLWLLILVSALTFGLSSYFSFKAYKITDVSTVSLVHKLNVVLAAVIGILFLSEKYSSLSYIGLLLIVISNLFIVYDGKKIAIERGIFYAFIMALTSALAAVFDKLILKDFSSFTYVFVNSILTGIMFSFRKGIFSEGIKLFKQNTKLVFTTSILNVGSWAAFLFVLQNTTVSKTFPIYKSLSLIVPVVLGIIILKERGKLWQKIVGATVGVFGIVLLALR